MRINKVAFAITTLLAASQVHAAGFQINEHSASGLGRAFAGEAAIGDNAASLARNPALMATFKRAQLSVVGTYVAPDVNITGQDEGFANIGGSAEANSASDVAPSAVVPAMYYVQPINDEWAFGLAMYSNFGTGTEYADDYRNNTAAGTTHIVTATFNPNISYRINEQFSIGAGVSAIYTTAELKRSLHILNGTPQLSVAEMEGDGINFGWNVGALYEVNENHRFGISYKHSSKMDLEGEYKGSESNWETIDGTMNNTLPAILELSGYHKLTNQLAVSYSWQYTTWSDFGDIVAHDLDGKEVLKKEENFNNSSRYSIGTEYYATENLTLRAGYAYDEQAADPTLSIPDSDRQWYTAGMTYKATKSLSFDLAAAFVAGKEVTFDEVIPGADPSLDRTKTFTSNGDAWLYSAQLNYSF
ncbi:OmpP1/FadL family transporter [Moritella sp. F3]|uniref:OmpP1/FadL family transporter n=1 Tax=Moritella sp. F3 TaxID=2718882 RepID=UPI0018E18AD6|nr:outer membrane protein transport protein [Moritella sp. F3]GIC78307.1 long-chain fatty acid outer membrane transporter [Moritella sp. F1]GIC82465.1 long-chain fatty acid outer membrane transporter [Moritella sp. F3]